MSLWIDETYLKQISYKLEGFKQIKNGLYNCRCPLCGDSETSKKKQRGYFFEVPDGLRYFCHKCNKSPYFSQFLKDYDYNLYKEYVVTKFKTSGNKTKQKLTTKKEEEKYIFKLDGLVPLKDLPVTHEAVKYIKSRKIPEQYYNLLYYSDHYMKWVNENVIPNKFEKVGKSDKRIVIPFFTPDKKVYAFTGRSLDPNNTLRYSTVKTSSDTLIYGLERLDVSKPVYVCEGQFDSYFVDNCLAAGGSSLKKMFESNLDTIFIFDNEPRSSTIIKLMSDAIRLGKKIVIFDKKFDGYKDINKIVQETGISKEELMKYLRKRTFHGLTAQLEFAKFIKNTPKGFKNGQN